MLGKAIPRNNIPIIVFLEIKNQFIYQIPPLWKKIICSCYNFVEHRLFMEQHSRKEGKPLATINSAIRENNTMQEMMSKDT